MGALSIQVEAVKESPRDFRLVAPPDWWAATKQLLREPDVGLHTPFTLELSGYRIGARLLFRGEMSGAVKLICSRCAEPYAHEFCKRIELLLEPARGAAGQIPKPGIVLDPEDPDLGHYEGDELGFEPVLREILALEWPMQPLCVETCKGLCPTCGTNRNQNQCDCDTREGLWPFAAFGSLLGQAKRARG